MTPQVQSAGQGGVFAWKTREIMVTVVIGLAFGLILIPATYAYIAIAAFGPLVQWSVVGFWFVSALFGAYVRRRPGTAFLVQFISQLVLVPFTPFGIAYLLSAVVYGIACEAGVALATRYRHFALPQMAAGGALSGLIVFLFGIVILQVLNFPLPIVFGILALCLISGALAGIVGKLLADAIARTGVLSSTAIGQVAEEV